LISVYSNLLPPVNKRCVTFFEPNSLPVPRHTPGDKNSIPEGSGNNARNQTCTQHAGRRTNKVVDVDRPFDARNHTTVWGRPGTQQSGLYILFGRRVACYLSRPIVITYKKRKGSAAACSSSVTSTTPPPPRLLLLLIY
jgi:hypothetical protein